MKITQEPQQFRPLVITLESLDEVRSLVYELKRGTGMIPDGRLLISLTNILKEYN